MARGLLGAYALVWLAVSGKFLKSEIKLILMSAEAREEEKKRMSAQMADTLKRMAEEVNIGSPLSILVNMMVLLPIILMVIDLGGFAIAACVVDLTGFQKLVYWIALTASVYMSVRVTKAIAKLAKEIAQKEEPEHVELVAMEMFEGMSAVSLPSFAAAIGKVTVAVLTIMAVFFS